MPWDFNCSNSSSIGKRVQAWLAHRVPVRLSNSSSIVNEQSSCACNMVGILSDGALLRTASLTSWILCWQSFRARYLDGFIDIGRFNFRFSTSSSQSPFYLQAAESAFVTNCESMRRTKGSPCLFRIEMTRTGERRKKEDMMVASQAEDPKSKAVRGSQQISATQAEDLKLYVAHSRSQQHRLKIQSRTWLTADLSNTGWRSNSYTCITADFSTPLLPCGGGGLKKTGRVCLSGDKYAFSVRPSDGELLNQRVFLDSLLTQFPCPLLMVGLRMPTGYVLSGANSPLLGWVCTVLEGSVDRVW